MRLCWRKQCFGARFTRISGNNALASAAFSLIELILVVAILILMVSLYLGGFSTRRVPSQKAACGENLQKLYLSLQIYGLDHGSKFPATTNALTSEEPLDLLVPKYSADRTLFICPGTKLGPPGSDQSLRSARISYAYWMGRVSADSQAPLMADALIDTLPKSSGQQAFSNTGQPPGNNHGTHGGNFLLCDGSVVASDPIISFSFSMPPTVTLLNPKP